MRPIERQVAYFESLTPESVQTLGEYYTADAFFKDPFNEVQGLAGIQAIFLRMFEQVDAPRLHVRAQVFDGAEGFLVWDLIFRFRGGRPARIHGVSHIKLAQDGRVAYHRDYWDSVEELYEKVPLLGALMRWLKRRVG